MTRQSKRLSSFLFLSCFLAIVSTYTLSWVYISLFASPVNRRAPLPPLRIHRNADDEPVLCVIPNVFKCVNFPMCHKAPLYVPIAYRPFSADILECLRTGDIDFIKGDVPIITGGIRFYKGDAPRTARQAQWHSADVLGRSYTPQWYKHFPHVAVKFQQEVIVPASLLLPTRDASLPPPTCYYPGQESIAPCEDSSYQLTPRVVISPISLGKPGNWTYEFLKLFTSGIVGNDYSKKMLHIAKPSRKWEGFQSLVISPKKYNARRNDHWMKRAGLSQRAKCTGRALIIVRDGRKELDRTVPPDTLQSLTKELRDRSNITVEIVTGLGQRPFMEQAKLVQNADVVLAVHGAELANMLFMREGASLIEIFPFAYWIPWYFQSIREALHLSYTGLSSAPDRSRFLKCMKSKDSTEALEKGIEKYETHVKMYRGEDGENARFQAGKYWSEPMWTRRCSRSQVIDFDPKEMANLIISQARRRCAAIR